MLLEVYLDEGCLDKIIWIHSPSGKYSCRSFKQQILKQVPIIPIWKAIWRIPTPLKLKSFLWFLLHGRLPVKDRLANFQLISTQENINPLYGFYREDITYLFLFCRYTSPLWYNVAKIWDMSFVCTQSMPTLFVIWFQTDLPAQRVQPWRSAFYALVWIIWTMRNRVVFHQECFDI